MVEAQREWGTQEEIPGYPLSTELEGEDDSVAVFASEAFAADDLEDVLRTELDKRAIVREIALINQDPNRSQSDLSAAALRFSDAQKAYRGARIRVGEALETNRAYSYHYGGLERSVTGNRPVSAVPDRDLRNNLNQLSSAITLIEGS